MVVLNDGSVLTQAAARGYLFRVTRIDGTSYSPAAEDSSLSALDTYVIDVPIASPSEAGGAAVENRRGSTSSRTVWSLACSFPRAGN